MSECFVCDTVALGRGASPAALVMCGFAIALGPRGGAYSAARFSGESTDAPVRPPSTRDEELAAAHLALVPFAVRQMAAIVIARSVSGMLMTWVGTDREAVRAVIRDVQAGFDDGVHVSTTKETLQ